SVHSHTTFPYTTLVRSWWKGDGKLVSTPRLLGHRGGRHRGSPASSRPGLPDHWHDLRFVREPDRAQTQQAGRGDRLRQLRHGESTRRAGRWRRGGDG